MRAKQHEPDPLHRFEPRRFADHGRERDFGGLGNRIAEDAGRDRGEGDRGEAVFFREPQRVAVAAGEQFRRRLVAAVNGPKAMDHEFVGQIMRAGDDGLARLDRGERAAFFRQSRPSGPVDRAGDAGAGHQQRIRRIHHGVDPGLVGDVALDAFEGDAVDRAGRHGMNRRGRRAESSRPRITAFPI